MCRENFRVEVLEGEAVEVEVSARNLSGLHVSEGEEYDVTEEAEGKRGDRIAKIKGLHRLHFRPENR